MLVFQYRSGFHVFVALTIKEKMNERERSQARALMTSVHQVLGAHVGQHPLLRLLIHSLCLLFQMHTQCAMLCALLFELYSAISSSLQETIFRRENRVAFYHLKYALS